MCTTCLVSRDPSGLSWPWVRSYRRGVMTSLKALLLHSQPIQTVLRPRDGRLVLLGRKEGVVLKKQKEAGLLQSVFA